MIFVERFAVDDRLDGRPVVILGDSLPALHALRETVAGLVHVEVEPRVGMEPGGGGFAAARMETHEDGIVILFARDADGDAAGEGAPGGLEAGGGSVPAKNPYDAPAPIA